MIHDCDFETWLCGDKDFAKYWEEKSVFPADIYSACLETNFLLERVLYEIYLTKKYGIGGVSLD